MLHDPIRLFVAKLERRYELPSRERTILLQMDGDRRDYVSGATVIAQGQASTHCVFIGDGVLSRQKTLPDGRRQVLAMHLRGDAVDLQSMMFLKTDHEIKAQSRAFTLWIPCAQILDLCEAFPLIAKALWLDCLIDAAIFREWIANIGQRGARERIAHLFVEMAARYDAIGALDEDRFELALNQQDIANALGLSLVHTNKSLRSLREANLLQIEGRHVTLLDRPGLERLATFDGRYLHLGGSRVKHPPVPGTGLVAEALS